MAGGKKKSKADRHKKIRSESDAKRTSIGRLEEDTDALRDELSAEEQPSAESETAENPPVAGGALTQMVPVRFNEQMLADVKRCAAEDHRSVSSWIRLAVDHELQRSH